MSATAAKGTDVPIKPGLFVGLDMPGPGAVLRGSRCAACDETFFPARARCPRCRSADGMAELALSRRGCVVACTRVERTPGHLNSPYVLAKIDLPEGVRIVSQVDPLPNREVVPGTPVELVTGELFTLTDGRRVHGYRFRAVQGDGESRE